MNSTLRSADKMVSGPEGLLKMLSCTTGSQKATILLADLAAMAACGCQST